MWCASSLSRLPQIMQTPSRRLTSTDHLRSWYALNFDTQAIEEANALTRAANRFARAGVCVAHLLSSISSAILP